ncbi:WYL domain-containing protein [Streptomyces sioyaensis]|uniref:WYL domain-containing protein n=1 Tax=Streptomyces sioyaensis TaxID=67364 RepID=UPI003D737ADB
MGLEFGHRLGLPGALSGLPPAPLVPRYQERASRAAPAFERPERPHAARPLPRPRHRSRHDTPAAGLALRLLSAPNHEPHPDPERGIPFRTDTEEILAGYAKTLNLTDIRQRAHAIHQREPITLEYLAVSGNRTVRTVSELELDPPFLSAYCHLREDQRVFNLSRIQTVMPA